MISIDDARQELIELRDELLDVGYEVDLEDDDQDHGVVLKVKLAGSDSVRMTVWCQDRDGRKVFRYGHPIHTPPLGQVDQLDGVVAAVKKAFGSP